MGHGAATDFPNRYDACVCTRFVVVFLLVAAPLACGGVLGASDDPEPPVRTVDAGDPGADGTSGDASDVVSDVADDAGKDSPDDGATGDGSATKDAGGDADAGRAKIVFVTSQRYTGNFGTRADADDECTFRARQANMALFGSSTFTAYLAAGNGGAAAARITDRVYARMDGKVVFNPGPQTNKTPSDLVVIDETGTALATSVNKYVWTGHADNVAANERTCADWTSGAGTAFGGFGDMHTTASWGTSTGATAGCDSSFRLYCFED